MEEMHYFKEESQRKKSPFDFKITLHKTPATISVATFCTWAQAMPVTRLELKKMRIVSYLLRLSGQSSEEAPIYSIYMEIIVVDEVQPLMAAKYNSFPRPIVYTSLPAFCADSSR